jgi:hypothetical protein
MTSEVRLMLQQTTWGSRHGKNVREENFERQFQLYDRNGGFENLYQQTSWLDRVVFVCSTQNNCKNLKVCLCDTKKSMCNRICP